MTSQDIRKMANEITDLQSNFGKRIEDLEDIVDASKRMDDILKSFKDVTEKLGGMFEYSEYVDSIAESIQNNDLDSINSDDERFDQVFEEFKLEFGILSLEHVETTKWILSLLNSFDDEETINKLINFGRYFNLTPEVHFTLFYTDAPDIDIWDGFAPQLEETQQFIMSHMM
jgi:hypothetical protein